MPMWRGRFIQLVSEKGVTAKWFLLYYYDHKNIGQNANASMNKDPRRHACNKINPNAPHITERKCQAWRAMKISISRASIKICKCSLQLNILISLP